MGSPWAQLAQCGAHRPRGKLAPPRAGMNGPSPAALTIYEVTCLAVINALALARSAFRGTQGERR